VSTRLHRDVRDRIAPVRIVHIGLGAFFRAHPAWYTDAVDDAGEWGIAAFTGRRPDAALTLASQDGLYTLVIRSAEGDDFSVVSSIVAAYDGADLDRLAATIAAPDTAIVTLTVTEPAYHLDAEGRLQLEHADVAADLRALRDTTSYGRVALTTMPARLAYALDARRRAGSGPLAVVPCDNLSDNGPATRTAILGVAAAVHPELPAWIETNVSFVSTSIDRITPRTTPADVKAVAAACGYDDETPVITEPFTDWVLCGDFPAGRPAWERAGAVFVDDVTPWEQRKLWLLNGAHSLMSYLGILRGHATVADAVADPECVAAVQALWELVAGHLTDAELDLPRYEQQLLERWRNPRIDHRLAQIALDGTSKLPNRLVWLVDAERGSGRSGDAALLAVAAWIEYICSLPSVTPDLDSAAARLEIARALTGDAQTKAFVALVDPAWARDDGLLERVRVQRSAVAAMVNPGA
jgi:fructuronate reductase